MASADAAKPGSTPGAGAIAGAILLRDTLARTDIDDRTKAVLTKQLRGVLPGQVVQPGGTLVQRAGVTATVSTGAVEFTLPVSCDQTGDTPVTVTFVAGSANRPAGGVATTEDRPRGDPVIVENWHEQLIAFAWNILLIATSALSGTVGADRSGRPLIVGTLAADRSGLSGLPMAR